MAASIKESETHSPASQKPMPLVGPRPGPTAMEMTVAWESMGGATENDAEQLKNWRRSN